MKEKLFDSKGHIKKRVFMSDDGMWQAAFSPKELKLIASHLKQCDKCRQAEINTILYCAEHASERTVMKLVDTIDPNAMNNSEEDTASVLPFERYPTFLMENILQYTKGQLIRFTRDDDGWIQRITGTTDGDVESSCVFVRDGAKTSVHCHCHNCEDKPDSEVDRVSFADFHIDFSRKNLIAYTVDIIEFIPEYTQVNKYHYNIKLYLNDSGKVTSIQSNGNRFYQAEYDGNNNIVKEINGKTTTVFDYTDNKKTGIKTISGDGVECNLSFEYGDMLEAPAKIFSTHGNDTRLIQLNKFKNHHNKDPLVEMIHDGIARGYYDANGLLNVKVWLPERENVKVVTHSLNDFKEYCGSLNTIDAVIADQRTRTMRILKKIDGERKLDQTSTHRDGLIIKVYSHKDAALTSVLSSHFSSRHWSDTIEKNDGIL